ncbi:DUF447 family protein [Desulfosporosinus metallidurans]|uniref:DUF447 family protein n=2 Tax=Desulfosporosinus metallidurans TaxID=1888891 RepID=A0A1Q8QLX6_9FIRM|nr:DUF447 family protein [Desulfosporosinus metallidurans]
MILETILSSISVDGIVNFAPMGMHLPDTDPGRSPVKRIVFRLYPGSQTYENLKATGQGVINFTDDVLVFVETALYSGCPPFVPSQKVRPPSMAHARTIWEFTVTCFDPSTEPAFLEGKIEHREQKGGFEGFCRAQGAVLEAAIAATRWQWLPIGKIIESWPLWLEVVEKTGGNREQHAFNKVGNFLGEKGIQVPRIPWDGRKASL